MMPKSALAVFKHNTCIYGALHVHIRMQVHVDSQA